MVAVVSLWHLMMEFVQLLFVTIVIPMSVPLRTDSIDTDYITIRERGKHWTEKSNVLYGFSTSVRLAFALIKIRKVIFMNHARARI